MFRGTDCRRVNFKSIVEQIFGSGRRPTALHRMMPNTNNAASANRPQRCGTGLLGVAGKERRSTVIAEKGALRATCSAESSVERLAMAADVFFLRSPWHHS